MAVTNFGRNSMAEPFSADAMQLVLKGPLPLLIKFCSIPALKMLLPRNTTIISHNVASAGLICIRQHTADKTDYGYDIGNVRK